MLCKSEFCYSFMDLAVFSAGFLSWTVHPMRDPMSSQVLESIRN